jgi:broad specificity phosphatase PhoE
MMIKLVRHGQSHSNTGEVLPHEVGDYGISLTANGIEQAQAASHAIGQDFIADSLLYCSPYKRTRETAAVIVRTANLPQGKKIYEDPRLREVERGYMDEEPQHHLRKVHGWFYYRHAGGESPADCYDRTSAFLESLMRQAARHDTKKILIVTHGMTIRCFVTRFLHLTVEQFEMMANPSNCDIITIAPAVDLTDPVFTCSQWGVDGIALRKG